MSGNFTKNSKTKARGVLARQGCSEHGYLGKKMKGKSQTVDDFLTHDKQLLLSGCARLDYLFLFLFFWLLFLFLSPLEESAKHFLVGVNLIRLYFIKISLLTPEIFVLFVWWVQTGLVFFSL